jgi:glycerol uptake operon antiterminator
MGSMQNILIKKGSNMAVFNDVLHKTRIIPAVKSMEGVERCLQENEKIVFVLFGDIITIPDIVARLKYADKTVLVHIDLIDGLNSRDVAVDFIAGNTRSDGILSTKANLVKYAKNHGLLAIQRFFVLDSMALLNIEKQFPIDYADALEILPGLMPKVIRRLAALTNKPIIAGGLISDMDDVKSVLNAGASAVSTTKLELIKENEIT